MLRLLLIEDNAAHAKMLIWLLRADAEIEHRESLGAGIAAAHADKYNAVILDLNLPDSKGAASLTRFRESCCYTPVVVVSGAADFDAMRPALRQVGAVACFCKNRLEKPSDLRLEIIDAVRAAIEETAFFKATPLIELAIRKFSAHPA